jgi:hypothetical protein
MAIAHVKAWQFNHSTAQSEEYVKSLLLEEFLADWCDDYPVSSKNGALEKLANRLKGVIAFHGKLVTFLLDKGVMSLEDLKDMLGHEGKDLLAINNEWDYKPGG